MKLTKILSLSIISLLVAQYTALAEYFKFHSRYPEIILHSSVISNPSLIISAKTLTTDSPLQVCWKPKESETIMPLFDLDTYFSGQDEKYLTELVFEPKNKDNKEDSVVLIVSVSEAKCIADNPCFLSSHQTNEFNFTIIKAYRNDVELELDQGDTLTQKGVCMEASYLAYLQDHPKEYLNAAFEAIEHCSAQDQKDEL